MNKVLIIGASGFLGSYCFNKFSEDNQLELEDTRNSFFQILLGKVGLIILFSVRLEKVIINRKGFGISA